MTPEEPNAAMWRYLARIVLLGLPLSLLSGSVTTTRAQPTNKVPAATWDESLLGAARDSMAQVFASLVEQAIPREYEKRKDWGNTKNLTVGIRTDGLRIHRRKKPVKHGVWKHYRVRLVEPQENLLVRMDHLRALDGGRVACTLVISAELDCWLRTKVYQDGIHLIALEVVGDTRMQLSLDCEVAARIQAVEGSPRIVIDPQVTNSSLKLSELHLQRISNADGPLVSELGGELKDLIEDKLHGPKLTAKLNRAIDKKRDRLTLDWSELLNSSWWPLARLPDIEAASGTRR